MKLVRKISALLGAAACCSALTLGAGAAFAKNAVYTDGQFADVPVAEWYADSVKDAYEFGIMNGNSASTFAPDGTLSVAEGITVAARIYETLTGTPITDVQGGEWYQKYVDYAIANGLMKSDSFDNYDREIKRYETALLLEAASRSVLTDINTVESIPDVPANSPAYAAISNLYEAGILTGNDEYGTFAPVSNLKRCEMAAMAVRSADNAKRVAKTFTEEPVRNYTDSYYLVEVPFSWANSGSARYEGVPNGWNGDNRFMLVDNSDDANRFISMSDYSEEQYYALNRDINEESEGVITTEVIVNAKSSDNGVFVALQNLDEENIVTVTPVGGFWAVKGIDSSVSEVKISENEALNYAISITLDLDKNTASVKINNKDAGSVFVKDLKLSRLKVGTSKEGTGSIYLDYAEMWKNHPINERFVVPAYCKLEQPLGWDITGDFTLRNIDSQYANEIYSLKSETTAGAVSTASTSFEKMSGPMGLEAFVLFPKITNGAKVSFTTDGVPVLTFETKNGKLYFGDIMVNDYIANIWQHLQIDADTTTGKATVKVNGKAKAEVSFNAPYINGFVTSFAPVNDAEMWLDDIRVYNLLEHEDYPSYPQVAESTDYNIGINVCWLWRDFNVREGWDSVSSFPEFEPYLGYYDEGSREYADWEIKQLVEHGVDFLHACWYSPNGSNTTPIKNQDYSFSALHDGYFNAKYSDLIDFCIMWENARGADFDGFDAWRDRLWNYWIEYYFKDDRYLRLDNKAVLTVFKPENLERTFGSVEGVKKAIEFMNEDIKKYGYDGIIVLSSNEWHKNYDYMNALGFDGTYAYQWGREGSEGEYQIAQNRLFAANSEKASSHHIPTVSVGFNAVGRGFTRSPFVSTEDHLAVCEDIKELLATYNTGTWKDNTLMISTWNEYSEGHFVAPTESIGFELLENIRKTFTNDTSDHTQADAKPTEEQKARITKMYPPKHSPIRQLMLEDNSFSEDSLDEYENIMEYDLSPAMNDKAWKANHNMAGVTVKDGILSGKGLHNDFGIINTSPLSINAADVDVMHLRMKTGATGKVEIFFATKTDPALSGAKSLILDVNTAGEFVDYYFLPSQNTSWTGEVTTIRLDPCSAQCDFEIESFRFLKKAETLKVYTNGALQNSPFTVTETADGDFEMAVTSRFFTKNGLYHEFDRFTDDGVLTLYNRNNDKFVLSVGKDTVLVNGEEKPLGFTLKIRDGLPVIHVMKLINLVGYEVSRDGNSINIVNCTDEELEILKAYENDCYEFGLGSETFGFTGQNTVLSAEGGYLKGIATGLDQAIILRRQFSTKYNVLRVGIKYEEGLVLEIPQMFYQRADMTGFAAEHMVGGEYIIPEDVKPGDTVEAYFNLYDAPAFDGVISAVRIDPFIPKQDFYVDYVRFEYDEQLAIENEKKKEEEAALMNSYQFVEDENQWFLDVFNPNADGWTGQCTSWFGVENGFVKFIPNADDTAAIRDVKINAADYQVIVYGIRYNAYMDGRAPDIFFMNDGDTGYTGAKGIKGKYVIPEGATYGDIILAEFDMRYCPYWKGDIKRLRMDPYTGREPYEIAYMRLCTAEIPEELIVPEATRPTEVIINAGEELPEGIKITSANADVTVVENPEKPSEKVFKVGASTEETKYVYMYINMQYEADATYSISYKIYPLKDAKGKSYSTNIAGSLRYGTQANKSITDHRVGHDVKITEGKGWVTIEREMKVDAAYYPQGNDSFMFWGTPENGVAINFLVKDIKIVKK